MLEMSPGAVRVRTPSWPGHPSGLMAYDEDVDPDLLTVILSQEPYYSHGPISTRPVRTSAPVQELSSRLKAIEERLDEIHRAVTDLAEELSVRPIVKHTNLLDLDTATYSLKCPLPVVLEEYGDEVVASIPELKAFGSADTDAEAISNLRKEIVALYEDLDATESDDLGRLPTSWLRILRATIEKHA